MDDCIPGETCVVHDDVDLALSKLGGLLDELLDVIILQQVARHGNRLSAVGVDLIGYVLGLCSVNV